MARRPDGAQARTLTLNTRITPAGMVVVDRCRVGKTRSEYVRALLAADARRQETRR